MLTWQMIIIECQTAFIPLWSKCFLESLNFGFFFKQYYYSLICQQLMSLSGIFLKQNPFHILSNLSPSPPQIKLIFLHVSELFPWLNIHLYLLSRELAKFILQILNRAYKLTLTIFMSSCFGSLSRPWLFHNCLNLLGPFSCSAAGMPPLPQTYMLQLCSSSFKGYTPPSALYPLNIQKVPAIFENKET